MGELGSWGLNGWDTVAVIYIHVSTCTDKVNFSWMFMLCQALGQTRPLNSFSPSQEELYQPYFKDEEGEAGQWSHVGLPEQQEHSLALESSLQPPSPHTSPQKNVGFKFFSFQLEFSSVSEVHRLGQSCPRRWTPGCFLSALITSWEMSVLPFDPSGHLKNIFRGQRNFFSFFLFIVLFWEKLLLLQSPSSPEAWCLSVPRACHSSPRPGVCQSLELVTAHISCSVFWSWKGTVTRGHSWPRTGECPLFLFVLLGRLDVWPL